MPLEIKETAVSQLSPRKTLKFWNEWFLALETPSSEGWMNLRNQWRKEKLSSLSWFPLDCASCTRLRMGMILKPLRQECRKSKEGYKQRDLGSRVMALTVPGTFVLVESLCNHSQLSSIPLSEDEISLTVQKWGRPWPPRGGIFEKQAFPLLRVTPFREG